MKSSFNLGCLASLIWLAVAPSVPAWALDTTKLQPRGYVSDYPGVVDMRIHAQLERYLTRVEQATGAEVALVLVDSLDGEPIEDVANRLYRQWAIGKKGKNEGILVLLAVRDHKDRIEVGYGLEPVLSDGFVGSTLRDARPALRAGNYNQALLTIAQAIGTKIGQEKGVVIAIDDARPRQVRPQRSRGLSLWWIIIVVVVLALISRGGGGGFWTGLLLGNLLGGGRRGWSGGGFGGYDSGGGGGFGGFGGGDSGGGGASSDW